MTVTCSAPRALVDPTPALAPLYYHGEQDHSRVYALVSPRGRDYFCVRAGLRGLFMRVMWNWLCWLV